MRTFNVPTTCVVSFRHAVFNTWSASELNCGTFKDEYVQPVEPHTLFQTVKTHWGERTGTRVRREAAVWTYPPLNTAAAAVSFGVLGNQYVSYWSCQTEVRHRLSALTASLSPLDSFRWFWTIWCWIQCLSCLRPSGRTRSSWQRKWSEEAVGDFYCDGLTGPDWTRHFLCAEYQDCIASLDLQGHKR